MICIGKKESETNEYKSSLAELDEGGETVCGFANQQGGVLYFGIKNNSEIVGISNVNEKTIRDVTQQILDNTEPKIYFSIIEKKFSGIPTIKIEVQKSSQPTHTYKSIPYLRIGPSTKRMSQTEYQRRLMQYKSVNKDYSSNLLLDASLKDLSKTALNELRRLLKKSGRYKVDVDKLTDEQLLKNLLLLRDKKLTIASLVLLGTEDALARHLPYSEIRYGYKTSENEVRNQDMAIFREAYLDFYPKMWEKIDSKNLNINFPYKMRLIEKKAFDEETIREAINNAVVHRDYLVSSSIIIIQYPYKIIITSPGGFPDGVTIKNIIDETKPRNKLIADILFKCEMVEQFGTGVNLMYRNQLTLGKLPPNYEKSDDNRVELSLDGKIQDKEFAKYVMRIAEEKNKELNDQELVLLNRIRKNQTIQSNNITDSLLELGLIEKLGRNRYMLSKQYYVDIDQKWEYTKKKGLTKEKNKELILQHLVNFGPSKKEDFIQLFQNSLSERQISWLLVVLKKEDKIKFEGPPRSRNAKWALKDS